MSTEQDGVSNQQPERVVFIPHGATCVALDGLGSDFGLCHRPAVGIAWHKGRDRYVCDFHFKHFTGPKARGSHV